MEKRAVLAAILMAGLVIIYQAYFIHAPEPERAAPAKTEAPAPQQPNAAAAPVPAAPVRPSPTAVAEVPERTVVVETPLYRAAVASAGGALREWQLNYRGHKPMVVPGVLGPRGLQVERAGSPTREIAFKIDGEDLKLGPSAAVGEIRLTGEDGFGLQVSQKLRFRADSYAVEQAIKVENLQSVPQRADLVLPWRAPAVWPPNQEEPLALRPVHVVRLPPGAFWAHREYLSNAVNFNGGARWIGFESSVAPTGGTQQNGVYLSAMIPLSPGMTVFEAPLPDPDPKKPLQGVDLGVRVVLPTLSPGQTWEGRVLTYAGPMEYDRLKAFGTGLEKAIYFGGFPLPESWAANHGFPTMPMEWFAVPVLWLMHWFYTFTGNYGIAIILLTVIAKVLFFPLSVKSMKSMKAMQVLQPQVNALRSKYKNEPQKLQQETMELYRTHGVNPLGGCLPMVVQVPIFYALYVALAVSVELQNAPFLCFGRLFGVDLWICDLAAHDPTYILPILMGVSMFIQQKMTPITGDPRQAKMMLFMPVVFTFMFLNLPSGLVLYWTLSNVLQIAQQYYMNQEDKTAKAPARAAKKA